MKRTSNGLVIAQAFLLLIFLFTSFMINHLTAQIMIGLLVVLMIVLMSWRLASMYDRLWQSNHQLNREKKALQQSKLSLERKNEDFQLLFNSLDGAIFSIDPLKKRGYFSNGTEELLGYSVEELNHNPHIFKELIHVEDLEKYKKAEMQLKLGNLSEVKFRIAHPNGDEKWVEKVATPFRNQNGIIEKIVGQMFDITDQMKLEHALQQLAYNDDLTDLPNRKALDRHIEKALARSKRHEHNFTLMFIDLDDFKKVNDTMGHEAGDVLLKEVVNRLQDCIRDEDLISRIGGDEFIVVFEETNKAIIEEIAERIIERVALPYFIHEQEAKISLSIGVSMYPDDGIDKETLIDHADKAMYYAKNNGKNNYKIYTPDLQEMESKKGILEKWIDAIQNSKVFSRT
ncbi:diguanylate cyclase/phosphodiesterase [Halalkalibacter wakoensis JCM 9140]|uniref:Diguanylate cyclase/phosphodiesterase n=1 Tax=Halalkalibacter wakoensis JCM 9140 TaxID=1236970 RepID=W4Q674_9BACI|nr:sensor domain-containing diguanylate cyclase [Halalkalibacter wakoensis]GAE27440.1 diguanylate cyclase/phosphodiesterase [Halalkalibacter wakoensis JCM 9140]